MKRGQLFTVTAYSSALRLLAQIVALISGLTIASTFGETDSYYAALILPAALANLAINILTNLFAPIYLEHIHTDPAQRRPILASLTFFVTIALVVGIIISLVAVPISIHLRGGQTDSSATIFGVSLVALVPLLGYSRLTAIICEAHQHYRAPALAALLNPLTFLITLLILLPHLSIYSLLCANLAGHSVELLAVSIYARRRLQIPFRPSPRLHPAIREMLLRSLLPALTYGALFFVPTLDRLTASILSTGSLTAFHYGERLVTALDLLIITSVVTVASNQWAQRAAERGIDSAAQTANDVFSLLLFVLMPIITIGAVLSHSLLALLFQHGAYTNVDASAQVFAILLVSAPFNYLIVLNVRLLLIARDVRAQAILSLGIALLNALLDVALAPLLGLTGIALSTLVARALIFVLSRYLLHRRIPSIHFRPLLPNLIRTLISATTMLVVLLILDVLFSPALSGSIAHQIAALGLMITASGIIYLSAAALLRHPDLLQMIPTFRLPTLTRLNRA
ncbi:MAG TPA: lipid II flippase MurJ [Phototrophicaceae bacterium]|nr:lipid II flippase MurJ [Phototrophicaceae bacterium]